jgi:hypothetical protein
VSLESLELDAGLVAPVGAVVEVVLSAGAAVVVGAGAAAACVVGGLVTGGFVAGGLVAGGFVTGGFVTGGFVTGGFVGGGVVGGRVVSGGRVAGGLVVTGGRVGGGVVGRSGSVGLTAGTDVGSGSVVLTPVDGVEPVVVLGRLIGGRPDELPEPQPATSATQKPRRSRENRGRVTASTILAQLEARVGHATAAPR